MTTQSSRRAILAGAATLPLATALALPAGAAGDPIFAAIERHKIAYRICCERSLTRFDLVDATWSPRYDAEALAAATAAADDADEEAASAAFTLTTIRPATMAGVLALIRYVEAFNSGSYAVGDWGASSPMHWPECDDADEMDQFGYLVLGNVRAALEALAVQS